MASIFGYGQIYKIQNSINGKVYIGQTIHEDVVYYRYGCSIKNHTHNKHLKCSMNKYGEENFKLSTICWRSSKKELDETERFYIYMYDATNQDCGYNIDTGGHGGILSEEGKIKATEASRKYWATHPEKKERKRQENLGKNNFLVRRGGHTEADKGKMRRIRLQMMEDGIIDCQKWQKASLTKRARMKRGLSLNHCWYIQYNANREEVNRWCVVKWMYDDLCSQGECSYSSYDSFKHGVKNKFKNSNTCKTQNYIYERVEITKQQVDTEITLYEKKYGAL